MLSHTLSRWLGINNWAGQPLLQPSPAIEEGMALNGVWENGQLCATVLNSTANTDIFLGFCFGYFGNTATVVGVETYTVPAGGGNIILLNNPVTTGGGQGIRVYNNNTNTAVGYNATPGTGVYQISGSTLTFNAAQAGNSVTVYYSYSPTLIELQQRQGDGTYFGAYKPSDITGTIGLIREGLIYTTNFDPSVDYTVSPSTAPLKVGPNGMVTTAGNGATINGKVVSLPNGDYPYLGIDFSAN